MRTKILYLSFACLIIAILISIFIIRQSLKIQPALEEANHQEIVTPQESALPGETEEFPAAFNYRPAITIIKPSPKESLAPAQEEKINQGQQLKRLPASPSQTPVVSEGESEEPASGAAKIGKYPTQEEESEMNARGTVMY